MARAVLFIICKYMWLLYTFRPPAVCTLRGGQDPATVAGHVTISATPVYTSMNWVSVKLYSCIHFYALSKGETILLYTLV